MRWKCKDKDIIEYIKSSLNLSVKTQIVDNKYYAISKGSKELCNEFMSYGIVPNKTYMCIFPTIDIKYFKYFLRGYFDGDGSVSIRKEKKGKYIQTQFVNKLKYNLQELGNIIKNELGCIPHIYPHEGSYRLNYTVHATISLYHYIYDNKAFFLNRKKDVFKNWLKERNQPNYGRRVCEICNNTYSVLHDKSRVCYKCKIKVKTQSDLIGDNKLT